MARPKEFIEEEAIERGMLLLWERGYEATSLDELLPAMGLSRSSFYTTFVSKRDFLLAALDRYIDTMRVMHALRAGSRAAIALALEMPSESTDRRGCFLNNCAIEAAHRDPGVRATVTRGFARLEEAFYEAVARGQKNGEISRKRDARVLARYVLNSFRGLTGMSQAGCDRESMKQVATITLSALE
jgi:TetR/AcrR family transcriptional repressor of nem operon